MVDKVQIKLFPCPFCGKNARSSDFGREGMVECGNPHCPICDIPMSEEHWNVRLFVLSNDEKRVFSDLAHFVKKSKLKLPQRVKDYADVALRILERLR